MSKHTPGPWEAGPWIQSQGSAVYRQIRGQGRRLSSVSVYGKNPDGNTGGRRYRDKCGTERQARTITVEECDANARLIAAAPLLLEALQTVVSEWDAERLEWVENRPEVLALEVAQSEAGPRPSEFIRAAREAIKEATGETK